MSEYPASASNQNPSYEDGIDLRELIKVLSKGKLWIIGLTFIAAVISVIFALSLPNIYRAEALLAADEGNTSGLSSLTDQYGGLARLAGINLPVGETGEKAIGIAKLQSRRFMADFMERHDILPELMAASVMLYSCRIINRLQKFRFDGIRSL